jgi:hypothetical protein
MERRWQTLPLHRGAIDARLGTVFAQEMQFEMKGHGCWGAHQATRLLEGKDDPRLEAASGKWNTNLRSYSTAVQVSEHKPAREEPVRQSSSGDLRWLEEDSDSTT